MTENAGEQGGTRTVLQQYIEAVGRGDLAPLDELLDDDLVAMFAGARSDKSAWIAALHRLLPALVRNDIREIFADGSRGTVVYDFVTDTSAGAILCVELATVRGGRITEIELVLDRAAFAPVRAELEERARAQASAR